MCGLVVVFDGNSGGDRTVSFVGAVVFSSNPSYIETDLDAIPQLPEFTITKNSFELRYNQPEGSITLWDTNKESAIYTFEAETLQQEALPKGVREHPTNNNHRRCGQPQLDGLATVEFGVE